MKKLTLSLTIIGLLAATTTSPQLWAGSHDHGAEASHEEEVAKGPNNGRMLVDGDFAIELQLFENGLPPEFRIFATEKGKALASPEVEVKMELVRLGDQVDVINFAPMGPFLRGDTVIYEPHSFVVKLTAKYRGKVYQWQYDNFEGRTHISDNMAGEMALATELVNEQKLTVTTPVYGEVVLPENASRHLSARYPGKVTHLYVRKGQMVKKGQALMRIQSNDSLQTYTVKAPINGVVTEQNTGVGEQAFEQNLLTLVDMSQLYAELKVFPQQQTQVKLGAQASLEIAGMEKPIQGVLWDQLFSLDQQQARTYRVKLDNKDLQLLPGQFVKANIVVDEFIAPMAVKRDGLQAFRDFTVVYAKVGEEYEVRMLELGRQAGEWVEVLSGIELGTEYVTQNSYIIKADIEKSGASHDH